jgi:hypothetical protein
LSKSLSVAQATNLFYATEEQDEASYQPFPTVLEMIYKWWVFVG